MENAYAQALWNIIKGGMKPTEAVHALHEQLKKSGRVSLAPRVARAFERIADRDRTHNAVILTVADKKHEHSALAQAATASKMDLSEKNVEVSVDPSLIGGWRLDARETLLDGSYKKHLLAIYRAATNA
jgi:F0F1-type ATP synthase delta subunit